MNSRTWSGCLYLLFAPGNLDILWDNPVYLNVASSLWIEL